MYRSRLRAISIASLVAVIVLLSNVSIASAHEHREVNGYELTVGFRNEPALVNEPNGLDLRVMNLNAEEPAEGEEGHSEGEHAGVPVEGLADTLQAEIIYGEESMSLELYPRFGQPGAYTADVIPTATGAYTFHIWGNIEGTEIDESFTGGPDTFSEVESKDTITFPSDAAGTEATGGDNEGSDTLAIAGIVLGSLGLLAGLAGVVMAMNARNAQPRRTTVAAGEVGD